MFIIIFTVPLCVVINPQSGNAMVQTESWVPSQDVVCVGFVVIRSSLGVKLTACLQLVLRLRMFGARHTLPLYVFMACIETTLSFTSSIIDSTSVLLGLNPGASVRSCWQTG